MLLEIEYPHTMRSLLFRGGDNFLAEVIGWTVDIRKPFPGVGSMGDVREDNCPGGVSFPMMILDDLSRSGWLQEGGVRAASPEHNTPLQTATRRQYEDEYYVQNKPILIPSDQSLVLFQGTT
jgi:hypothetical protein